MVVSAEHCKFGAFATTDGKFKNLLRIVKNGFVLYFIRREGVAVS